MKKIVQQHGDVVIEKVESIPVEAKRLKVCGCKQVIERGEGIHEHIIVAENMQDLCDLLETYELNGDLYFRVKKGQTVKLTHEEHGTQILEPGIYKKNIEQVFDYEKMESEKVRD